MNIQSAVRYNVTFCVNHIEPRYKRGMLYSMCCSVCRKGELAISDHTNAAE